MLSISNTVRRLFARSATPSHPRRTRRSLRLECLEERTLLCNPGELDLTFDGDGKLTTDFGYFEQANDVAIQPDGKILVAGRSGGVWAGGDFALARYAVAGTLDTSFGNGGKVTTSFGLQEDSLSGIAVQPDGKIIATGVATLKFRNSYVRHVAVARYNPNGTLDKTFDKDGKVTTRINDYADGLDVAVQPDGKIVVVGRANIPGSVCGNCSGLFAVVRYNSNGSLDTSFDGDGIVTTDVIHSGGDPFGAGDDGATSVAILTGGKILVHGWSSPPGTDSRNFAVVRYNANGSIDTAFGTGGQVVTRYIGADTTNELSIGNYWSSGGMAVQTDGRFVVAGGYGPPNSNQSQFALARYNSNGALDSTFDGDGFVTTAIGPNASAGGLSIQTDGKIVAVGFSDVTDSNTRRFTVARYDATGMIDPSFDIDGIATTTFASMTSVAKSVALQNDGHIVVVGGARITTGAEGPFEVFAAARYCP